MALPAILHANPGAKLALTLSACALLLLLVLLSCVQRQTPQQLYDRDYQILVHGPLGECAAQAEKDFQAYRISNPAAAARFANLQAECLVWAGLYEDALAIYSTGNLSLDEPDSRIRALSLQTSSNAHLQGGLKNAHARLQEAERLCAAATLPSCLNLKLAKGILLIQEGELDAAELDLAGALASAQSRGDQFSQATALLDLGLVAYRQRHFDIAVDRITETMKIAESIGAREIAQTALGNEAWAFYRLGSFDRALDRFADAEQRAHALDDRTDQVSWLEGIGKIQLERSNFSQAAAAFQQALKLEERVKSAEDIYMAEVPLAQLALQRGALAEAEDHIQKALNSARDAENIADETYPNLIRGQLAARRGDIAGAMHIFTEVEENADSPVFVKWEAQRALAGLAEQSGNFGAADREFRAALATFEAARDAVQKQDSRLTFLTNAAAIYDDYIHFLVSHGRNDEALRWADYSRARSLQEGLGVLPKQTSATPPPLAAQEIARQVGGTLLFYWLGEKQSYLWAITARKIVLFTLPPGAQIEGTVQRYRSAIDEVDVLDAADENGRLLYEMLVTPVRSMLDKDAKVFILPDGQLNNLNFETLLVPSPKLHYWIDDVTIANASSLRMLEAWAEQAKETAKPLRSLLLIGKPVPPNDRYPELPKAQAQMDAVKAHFVGVEHKILTGAEATPPAYLDGHPENYSYIHFVTHGIASRLSPLDSAIVLSQSNADNDSFKLYARDIIQRPLRAELVTVAACYGAKGPAYSGEGLVGLSWAFLRAGAHNVVAALWEVTDAPAPQQMDEFYSRIERGESVNAALRSSKLALLHGDQYRNPYYWATFQLYVGARTRTPSTVN